MPSSLSRSLIDSKSFRERCRSLAKRALRTGGAVLDGEAHRVEELLVVGEECAIGDELQGKIVPAGAHSAAIARFGSASVGPGRSSARNRIEARLTTRSHGSAAAGQWSRPRSCAVT